MGLEPGYHVSKHVKLVRMLKRGGMGSVWVADHLALQTQVAVKFMSAEVADDPAMVTRFAREATSAAQIKSPHVVQVHDHGVTPEGDPFIVMELLEGEDLASRIKRVSQMSIEDVATILMQSCRVLGKAHQMGIVHRDIKPSNIFLADTHGDIFIKLLDFGVAKMGGEAEELTTTGAMVGTVVYMSPEQLLSARRVDHRSDLWSLAVVAYRALTGGLPFKDDEGLGALCRALESGLFFPPSELRPSLSPEIDAWFERAFQRDPYKRFQSAREFVDEFFLASGMAQAIMPPSTPSVSLGAVRDVSMRRQDLSVAAKSVQVERPFRSGPTVVPGRADPVTRPSRMEPTASSRRVEPTKSPLELGSPASTSAPDAAASTAAEEPASLGVAPALTLAGRASRPVLPPRRSFTRTLLIALGVLGALGAGTVFGLRYLGLSHPLPDLPRGLSVAPSIEDVGVRSATLLPPALVAATAPLSSAPPSALVVPGPTALAVDAPGAASMASAPSAPSAVPTARASASALAATPSGAPVVSGSGKRSGKASGATRPTRAEKDYGF